MAHSKNDIFTRAKFLGIKITETIKMKKGKKTLRKELYNMFDDKEYVKKQLKTRNIHSFAEENGIELFCKDKTVRLRRKNVSRKVRKVTELPDGSYNWHAFLYWKNKMEDWKNFIKT